jgi:hypothetical protein
LGIQKIHGIVDSHSGAPIQRIVEKCKTCGKIKYTYFNINADYEHLLNWEPHINLEDTLKEKRLKKLNALPAKI